MPEDNQQLNAQVQAEAVAVSAAKIEDIGEMLVQGKQDQLQDSGQQVEEKVEVMENKVSKIVEKAEESGGQLEMSEEHVEQIIDNDNYVNGLDEACGDNEYLANSMDDLREDPYYASLLSNTSVDGMPLDYKAEIVTKYADSDISIEEAVRTDLAEKLNVKKNDPALDQILHTINDYRGGGMLDKKKKVSDLRMTKDDGSPYDVEDKRDMFFGEVGEGGKRYGWNALDGKVTLETEDGGVMTSDDIYKYIDDSLQSPDVGYEGIVEAKNNIVLPMIEELRKENELYNTPRLKSYYNNLLLLANSGQEITAEDMEGLSQRHKKALISIMMAGKDAEERQAMAIAMHWKTTLDTGILFVGGPVGYGVYKGLESLHNKVVDATRPKEQEILVNEEAASSHFGKLLYYANKGAKIPPEVMDSLSPEEKKRIKSVIASNAQIEVTQAEQDATSKEFEAWLVAEEILVPVGAGMIGHRLLSKKALEKSLGTTVNKQIASKEIKAITDNLTKQELKAIPKMSQQELEIIAKRLGTTVDNLPGVTGKQIAMIEKKTLSSLGGELSNVADSVKNMSKVTKEKWQPKQIYKQIWKKQGLKDLESGMRSESAMSNIRLGKIEKKLVKSKGYEEGIEKYFVENVDELEKKLKVGDQVININNESAINPKMVKLMEKYGYEIKAEVPIGYRDNPVFRAVKVKIPDEKIAESVVGQAEKQVKNIVNEVPIKPATVTGNLENVKGGNVVLSAEQINNAENKLLNSISQNKFVKNMGGTDLKIDKVNKVLNLSEIYKHPAFGFKDELDLLEQAGYKISYFTPSLD